MRKEDTMTDDFQNVLRRVIAAQPKIYLSGHEGYYRHADIARLLRALTAWNTRPAPALDRDRIAVCISTHMSFGLGIDLPCVEVDKIADAILAMVGGGVPAGYKLVPVSERQSEAKQGIVSVEGARMMAKLLGMVEAQEADIIANPVKYWKIAAQEIGRLRDAIRDAQDARRIPIDLSSPEDRGPPTLGNPPITVHREDWDALKRMERVVMSFDLHARLNRPDKG